MSILTLLSESFLVELGQRAGFSSFVRCLPVRETSREDLFGDCLSMEEESDFETPHTLVIEMTK